MKAWFYLSFILTTLWAGQTVRAQCTSCTQTYNGGSQSTDFSSLQSGQTLCINANATNLTFDQNKTGLNICVAPGVTWTQSSLGAPGMTITVYGSMVWSGSYSPNARSTINVRSGGLLSTSGSNFSSNLTINNEGTVMFTNTGAVNIQGSFIFDNKAGGILNATAPSQFLAGNGTSFTNAGTMNFSYLEDSEALVFTNQSTGQMNINRRFYNHGRFVNEGQLQTTCTGSGAACEFVMGDKGPDKFVNNGCMKITGNVIIDGPGTINGTLEIASGYNLSINRIITGTNGQIIVNGGTSAITSAGQYTGTGMKFCDKNTAGNGFDSNVGNNPSIFTINCSGSGCATTSCPTLAVTAAPSVCNPATNRYTVTGTVSFTNAGTGSLTITDGTATTTVSMTGTSPQSYTLTGLVSNGASHTVTVTSSNTACSGASTTYMAPASCTCSISSVTLTQGACQSSNTNSTTADDFFTIAVRAQATNGGSTYEVVLNASTDGTGGTVLNPGGTAYGQSVTVGTAGQFRADGSTTYRLVIRDTTTKTCFTAQTTTPVASCSTCQPTLCPKITLVKQ